MGFSFQNIILLLNLINAVYSTQSSLKPTNSSGKPRMNDGSNDGDVKVTIAVVLGVGLTVIILGCFGFFLCRGHFERKKFHIHGQLVKMERKNKNSKTSGSNPELNEQSKDFAEEIL